MLDATRLRVLVAVARYGSVTGAAQALNYAQPSISHHIARLEAETGAKLMERSGRGVKLTEAGQLLADRAAEIIGRLDAAEAELATHVGLRQDRVRLAAFGSALSTLVAAASAELHAEQSDSGLQLVQAEPTEALRMLRAGEVDVALVYKFLRDGQEFDPPAPEARLHSSSDTQPDGQAVLDEPMYLVTAAPNPGTGTLPNTRVIHPLADPPPPDSAARTALVPRQAGTTTPRTFPPAETANRGQQPSPTNPPSQPADATDTRSPQAAGAVPRSPQASTTNTRNPQASPTNTRSPQASTTNTPSPQASTTNTPSRPATTTNTPSRPATTTNTPSRPATTTNTPGGPADAIDTRSPQAGAAVARAAILAAHADERWIAAGEHCDELLLDLGRNAGFIPDVVLRTPDFVAAQSLVAAGLGVTIMPGLALRAARHPGIEATPLPGACRRILALTYQAAPDSPAARRLIDALTTSTATPSTATPTPATPGTATPTPATPGTATPTPATPRTAAPTPATPGTATPGTATPGTATPGTATPTPPPSAQPPPFGPPAQSRPQSQLRSPHPNTVPGRGERLP
jgi:DNA-binding transcriptional LysR family regulator